MVLQLRVSRQTKVIIALGVIVVIAVTVIVVLSIYIGVSTIKTATATTPVTDTSTSASTAAVGSCASSPCQLDSTSEDLPNGYRCLCGHHCGCANQAAEPNYLFTCDGFGDGDYIPDPRNCSLSYRCLQGAADIERAASTQGPTRTVSAMFSWCNNVAVAPTDQPLGEVAGLRTNNDSNPQYKQSRKKKVLIVLAIIAVTVIPALSFYITGNTTAPLHHCATAPPHHRTTAPPHHCTIAECFV
ncbi:hypothetical protein LSAT2_010625 [Lamellibrachia satsuma]|nr:hypothetical protein LSAT2_010625 [Lamellibrachia satsuma]